MADDHVDPFLTHWPLPTLYDGDLVSTWKTLEEFKADGRARLIGVSNLQVASRAPRAVTNTVPAVNQTELIRTSRTARSTPTTARTGSARKRGHQSRRAW